MANIININKCDIANGPGIRVSVFLSGCERKCDGCFNSNTWIFEQGETLTELYYRAYIKPLITEEIDGISILGGEPLHLFNLAGTLGLVRMFKQDFPNKTIWIWTGETYEDLIAEANPAKSIYKNIFSLIDVLVDGPYDKNNKCYSGWKGSTNQRVIDIQNTLKQNKVNILEV